MISDLTKKIIDSMVIGLQDPRVTEALINFSQRLTKAKQSQILDQSWNDRELVRLVKFQSGAKTDLNTARTRQNAYEVPFRFRSVRVQAASVADVEVFLIAGKNIEGRDPIRLRQNDTVNFDYLTEGYLYWDAQAGETMQILFGVDVTFRQGSFILEQTGGVAITEGTDVDTDAAASVGTTAAVLCAADTTRVVTTIQNKTGQPIYLGDSTVTVATGFELAAGGVYEYKNSDALYAIAASATTANVRLMQYR